MSQRFAHAPNLAVQTLGQHNAKCRGTRAFYGTGQGHTFENFHARSHLGQKFILKRTIDHDVVFLFVLVASAQNFIDDVAIIGQENEAFTHLIQSSDWENPRGIIDEVDDVVLFADLVCGANNAHRLVQRDVNQLRSFQLSHLLAFHRDHISRLQPRAHFWDHSIDGHLTQINQLIGCPARAISNFAEVLVDAFAAWLRFLHGAKVWSQSIHP